MISEKGLLRAMKEAWKGADGYTLAVFSGQWFLKTEDWAVLVPRGLLPRKCLALIVEHVGEIPENGEAYNCSKKCGAQRVVRAILHEEVRELDERKELRNAKRTSLMYNGYVLWQNAESLHVIAIDETYSDIVCLQAQTLAFCLGDGVLWEHKGVVVKVAGQFMDDAARTYLSAMQWIE